MFGVEFETLITGYYSLHILGRVRYSIRKTAYSVDFSSILEYLLSTHVIFRIWSSSNDVPYPITCSVQAGECRGEIAADKVGTGVILFCQRDRRNVPHDIT